MAAVNAEAPAGTLTLDRPTGIEDPSWAAIMATIERLGRATSAGDLSQAVGVAKELVESVARSVLVVRGEVVAENAAFTGVVAKAHEVLDRQPGKGLTQAEPLRSVMQNAKAMACKLGDLRNSYGTGHGRAVEPQVTDELSRVCIDAALMWSRWALRRLDALAQGMPTPLINDLLGGGIFRSGLLTERLASADLAHQEPGVQRRIGVAVGQRAMRETFVVRRDGIEECAERDAPEIWPAAYREGAFEGLFVNPHGQLTVDSWSARWAPRLIAPLENPADVIGKLAARIGELPLAGSPPSGDSRDELIEDLRAGSRFLPAGSQSPWNDLVSRLETALR
jgi:Abortive infection C-terminus